MAAFHCFFHVSPRDEFYSGNGDGVVAVRRADGLSEVDPSVPTRASIWLAQGFCALHVIVVVAVGCGYRSRWSWVP